MNRCYFTVLAGLTLWLLIPLARGGEASVFVPLDSWVYSALVRLAGLGYVHEQAAGMRPWTRGECLRQLRQAEETLRSSNIGAEPSTAEEAERLVVAVRKELERMSAAERYLELDSISVRSMGIVGQPLADGYNFGQTIINDFGRPSAEGMNLVGNVSVAGVSGRWSFYTRLEFLRAPEYFSPAADLKPVAEQLQPVLPDPSTDSTRIHALEAYAGATIGGWLVTVGKQSYWWGPGEAGPLSFSNNAEPILSFRITRSSPRPLPSFFRRLGAINLEVMGGRLEGHKTPVRPLVNAQRILWIPMRGLEVGFTRWSLFGGVGVSGLSLRTIYRNFFANGPTFGDAADPGDRKSGFDFRWRLPVPGRFVSLYSDFYADDEPSPLASPRRSAFSPGVYLAKVPGFPNWDLRAEAPSTRLAGEDRGGTFLYWNNIYRSANTNRGRLLGSWVGRDARGLLLESTCWCSPQWRLTLGYRQSRIGPAFLPGGGAQTAAYTRIWFHRGRVWSASISGQFEHYSIPLLGPSRKDFSMTVHVHMAAHLPLLSH